MSSLGQGRYEINVSKKLSKQEKYERRKQKRIDKRNADNKKYDNYDNVFTYEHLLESAKKCKRNVGWKASVQNFFFELFYNIYDIYHSLENKQFKIKHSFVFYIFERGKKRRIRSVHIRERIVQRCLCDYCLTPILNKTFIYDNCASQEGKGTEFALNRLKEHLLRHYRKYGLDGYVLLFDFSDYFASISHAKIMEMFARYITDKDILDLIYKFISMEEGGKGLCLGNQVSQVAALLMASPIDHYIKDKCRVKGYIRYMDDGIVIHNDKKFLEELLIGIQAIADEYGLTINMKKTKIIKISHGFTFLKKKITLKENGKIYMRILRPSVVRMRRKLKKFRLKYDAGIMTFDDIQAAYQAWRSYGLKYNAYRSVCEMDKLFYELYRDIYDSMAYATSDDFDWSKVGKRYVFKSYL